MEKETGQRFSLRSATADLDRCSPALVSLVLSRKRNLSPERARDFAKILALSARERHYFIQQIESKGTGESQGNERKRHSQRKPSFQRAAARPAASNHILTHWLHPYVKDASRIKGFTSDPEKLTKLLRGLASSRLIARSFSFLLREGYLRRDLEGEIVENEVILESTDEIPSSQVRMFHRQALRIAADALETVPLEKREANTLLLPLNHSNFIKLKQLVKDWAEEIGAMAESCPDDDETLYQLIINLSPVAGEGIPSAP